MTRRRILAVQARSAGGGEDLPLIYAFVNFPPQELEAFLTAASMGQHFRTTIRPRYECVRVLPEPEPLATA